MEDEGINGTVLAIAQATKARPNQGFVFAQARWLTKPWTMSPRSVDIPGPLVDKIVISPGKFHWQSGTIEYDPRISYRIVPPVTEQLNRRCCRKEHTPLRKSDSQKNCYRDG